MVSYHYYQFDEPHNELLTSHKKAFLHISRISENRSTKTDRIVQFFLEFEQNMLAFSYPGGLSLPSATATVAAPTAHFVAAAVPLSVPL